MDTLCIVPKARRYYGAPKSARGGEGSHIAMEGVNFESPMGKPTIGTEILEWSKDRPVWQRDALRRLFLAGDISPADVDELVTLCKASHGLHPPVHIEPVAEAHIGMTNGADAEAVMLCSITHHQGVNALASEQTVNFGPALTVVYGQNAAGKSGYTRILKKACRSRSTESILGNVLSGEAPAKPRATIKYRHGTTDETFAWTTGTASPRALSSVSVFDSQCAPVYLKDKTDVAFRPFGLDIFDKLSATCGQVRTRLEAERTQLGATFRSLPQLPSGTKARALIESLTALTKPEDVRALATLSDDQAKQLGTLLDQRRDLQSADPKKLARALNLKAERIEGLIRHLQGLSDLFGDASLAELRSLEAIARTAQQALAQLQTAAMTSDLLQGTGGDDWKRMWKASELFSRVAYPEREFPATERDAVCLLCQQPIAEETAARLRHFAEYVRSNALQQVETALSALEAAQKPVRTAVVEREDVSLTTVEIATDDPGLGELVTAFTMATQATQNTIKGTPSCNLPDKGVAAIDVSPLRDRVSQLRWRAAELIKETPAMSADAAAALNELEAREMLGQNLQLILDEIDRRQRLGAYAQCIGDTATQAITRKSTEMTKELITDSLRRTFHDELQKLEFTHLSIEVQTAGGTRGALFHRLAFTNAPRTPVGEVLSEGEARTLSLAAFLTELQTAPARSAIIFDDPVSSLDHVWRERIARRLVAEARSRQVIVFTHDLLFLRFLLNDSARQEVACAHQYVERDGAAGISSPDLPWIAMSVSQRIGALRNRWQAAEKIHRTEGTARFEPVARESYRMVRQAWEQAVSEVLLNDVVERYRHSIETQKVRPLHDITQDDCDKVESEMAECSRWLHDEAPADATPIPGPDALKVRIDALETWVKNIRGRRKK